MGKVLFSCVGSSDPVANYYDGPILHILRNYQDIDKVYLYLSQEMWDIHHIKEGIYEYAFDYYKKNTNHEFEIVYINSGIVKVDDYDNFEADFSKYIKKIIFENESTELILNISSGSPAMTTTLLVLGLNIINIKSNVRIVQVTHPEKKANRGFKTSNKEYNIIDQMENNYDDLVNSGRCNEPKLFTLNKAKIVDQVKSFLESYNYEAAYEVYKSSSYYNVDTLLLINHLKKRVRFETDSIENVNRLNKKFNLNLLPIKNNYVEREVEFFLILKNYQKLKRVTDLIIRLNPLVISLQRSFLKKVFNFSIPLKRNKISVVDVDRFMEIAPNCYHYCNNKYKNSLDNRPISMTLNNYIIEHFINLSNSDELKEFLEVFKKLEIINLFRNDTAHNMENITDRDLNNDERIGVNSNWIIANIWKIIKYLYYNEKLDNMYKLYDDLNKIIITNL